MAQRGGAVLAHLRIAAGPIPSDLVPQGAADLIIAMEPLESLRYVPYLAPEGALVTAAEPVQNIGDYPPLETILAAIRRFPRYRLIDAAAIAREAALPKAVNMVMAGAASPFLPIPPEALQTAVAALFAAKPPAVTEANLKAFSLGRAAAEGSAS